MQSTAYKVLTTDQWRVLESEGVFAGAPVDLADGYIHLSTEAQLTETVDKHFAGQTGLIIAAVNLSGFGDAIRWEPSRGGQLFPHLYAPLPSAAVVAQGPVTRDADGRVVVPVSEQHLS